MDSVQRTSAHRKPSQNHQGDARSICTQHGQHTIEGYVNMHVHTTQVHKRKKEADTQEAEFGVSSGTTTVRTIVPKVQIRLGTLKRAHSTCTHKEQSTMTFAWAS